MQDARDKLLSLYVTQNLIAGPLYRISQPKGRRFTDPGEQIQYICTSLKTTEPRVSRAFIELRKNRNNLVHGRSYTAHDHENAVFHATVICEWIDGHIHENGHWIEASKLANATRRELSAIPVSSIY